MVAQPLTEDCPVQVPQTVCNGRFIVKEQIGSGCFGVVHRAVDKDTGQQVAVKLEDLLSGFLEQEVCVLRKVQQRLGQPQRFARLLHSGREGSLCRCVVMELLGPSLSDRLRGSIGGTLSAQSCILAAEQLIPCMEYLHAAGVVHRDVKPENFLTGLGDRSHHLVLIDFGLATEYHDGRRHADLAQTAGFIGSCRYASIAAHRCLTQSRRDDVEALGYVLVFLFKGRLPWSGAAGADWKSRNQQVLEKKEATSPAKLTEGMLVAFCEYVAHCRALAFAERPDYQAMLALFQEARQRLSEALGAPIKDHDVQWADREAQHIVAPLPRLPHVLQPEDRHRSRLSALVNRLARRSPRGDADSPEQQQLRRCRRIESAGSLASLWSAIVSASSTNSEGDGGCEGKTTRISRWYKFRRARPSTPPA